MIFVRPLEYTLSGVQPALAFPAISPRLEMGAYEALWMREGATFKTLAERFQERPGSLPSDFVEADEAARYAEETLALTVAAGLGDFGIRVHGAGEYPEKLRAARHPVEVLYFQGAWALTEAPALSVVGTRHPSAEGLKRTRKLTRELVEAGYTIASGLAAGIDTAAHTAALEAQGRTIAVLGTSLAHAYPPDNRSLQERLARDFLVVSQVPFVRYEKQNPRINRWFFPERNKTMSALTMGTVIVEAGETSGTLVQAREALHQGRKLFILNSAFENPKLTWPARFEKKGAVRVRGTADILKELRVEAHQG